MNAIDFFCGAGGLTHGLLDAGIEVIGGIDLSSKFKQTYEMNNGVQYICEDIRNVTKKTLKKVFRDEIKDTENLLFAGCAPCQPFSSQRRSSLLRKDTDLLNEFGRLVNEVKPGYIIIENVPGLITKKDISPFLQFHDMLIANKYKIAYDFINARDYGVPQNRRRFILIASKFHIIDLPEKTHGTGLCEFTTVRDTIKKFPPLVHGKSHKKIPNHTCATISELNLKRLSNTPSNGGDRRNWPDELVLKCHRDHTGHTDVYGRMWWDKPAPTLTGKCYSISNGRYGHPEQNRAISLREAAALQTFPDDYVFYGTNASIALQIGNAVPVLLGRILGEHILKSHKQYLGIN